MRKEKMTEGGKEDVKRKKKRRIEGGYEERWRTV